MSDARLRELERRWRETGTVEAEAAWLRERVRPEAMQEEEEVVIGDPANPLGIVRISSIKGDRVRLAFQFPREIQVHRREVADQILRAKPAVVGSIRPAGGNSS